MVKKDKALLTKEQAKNLVSAVLEKNKEINTKLLDFKKKYPSVSPYGRKRTNLASAFRDLVKKCEELK